jgi:hypothetical protein
MKKIFLSLALILMLTLWVALPVAAQTSQTKAEELTFEWEQATADLSILKGWTLYEAPTAGGPYTKVADVIYVPGSVTAFSSTSTLSVTGAGGTTVNRYYVLRSVNIENAESPNSNEVTYAFVIPVAATSAPFNLIIKIKTGVK